MILLQRRLIVECVDLADSATHKQRDDRFGPRLEVRLLGQKGRIGHADRAQAGLRRVRRRGSQCAVLLQQSGYDREAVTQAMYEGSLYLAACPSGMDLSVYVECAMAQVVDQLAWSDMVAWG